jgi:ABC-type polar amino acid transport system ATPase subunit
MGMVFQHCSLFSHLTVMENITMVPILIVTHDMRLAAEVADHGIFMAEGVIVEEGAPRQLFYNPTQERTQRFLAEVFK